MPDPTPPALPVPADDRAVLLAEVKGLLVAAAKPDAAGKRGWKTSEFWLTVLGQVAGCVVLAYGMHKGSDVIVAVGGLLAGGAPAPYALARALVKRAAPAASP